MTDPPAVHVGPDAPSEFAAAVEAGGGRLAGLEEADAVVWLGQDPAALPDLPEHVRWVQLPSAGVETWLASGRVDGDRIWTSAAGAFARLTAEHALALLLAGARRLGEAARARSWGSPPGTGLEGRTVAIVGAGGIGRALIELLQPFRCRVLAVTRRGHPVPGADVALPADRVSDVWPQADFVVLAAPATAGTRHLVGAEALAAMGPDAWLVNIARGSLVDTDALVAALASERIGGAALDVTDPEPLPDGHPLWDEPRALITPHVANPAALMVPALAERIRDNVARFAAGEDLLGRIDPDAGY